MDTSNWKLYYKIHEIEHRPTTTQMCYEPLVSPGGDIFCMNFNFPSEYQAKQPRLSYTKELVEFTFRREVEYLNVFQNMPWAPEIIDIDSNMIFIKWYGKTCNDSVYKDNDLNPNWYDDIEKIILDQIRLGFIKATIYPHSHYYDDLGNMRCIDFYATVERSNPLLSIEQINGLIGFDTNRFNDAIEGTKINIEKIFQSGLLRYSMWPKNLLEIYQKIYG